MKVLMHGSAAEHFVAELRATLQGEGFEIDWLPQEADDTSVAARMKQAHALICHYFDERLAASVAALELIQVPGAGYDGINFDLLPGYTAVCNVFGHEHSVAEFALLGMLGWQHPLHEADRAFRKGSWGYSVYAGAQPHGELRGHTLGIVGLGRIGRTLASMASALGMRVFGANRTPLEDPAHFTQLYSLSVLDELLEQSDFVALCIALDVQTEGLIGEYELSRMKREAVLVNVARGAVVDEHALYQALRNRSIGGAIIDTWYQYPKSAGDEPAPSRYPFHALPNVRMTPHMSGWTQGTVRERTEFMAGNLRRLQRGEPLQNRVDEAHRL